ncbi:MAG: hypothetical protein E2581_21235 [Pseudomonas sp.]|nr:hypothetical protein [Pseudomonas sp.]
MTSSGTPSAGLSVSALTMAPSEYGYDANGQLLSETSLKQRRSRCSAPCHPFVSGTGDDGT